MSLAYDMICKLNQDNYEKCVDVDTIEELTDEMVIYFEEYDMFNGSIEVDLDNFTDEEGEVDYLGIMEEEEIQKYNYIGSLISWEGKGEYCVVGYQFGEPSISKVEGLLELELDYVEFPIPLKLDIFKDTKKYMIEWKKSEGYKYAYLIDYVCHVGEPYFIANYMVFSNEKIDNIIHTLHEDMDIFIGDFNILGANYTVTEVEDFDTDDLFRYRFNDNYKIITID